MSNAKLTDTVWLSILSFLEQQPDIYGGQEDTCRKFVEASLWMLRSGAQWRLLPESQGKWNSVFKRFARWSQKGVWERMHLHFADDPDMESVMIDSTVVRAHACAAGARKTPEPEQGSERKPEETALGRSKGGFSTKIHVLVDALGMPLKFILTGGQEADVKQAIPLLQGVQAQYGILDKAYDADYIMDFMQAANIIPVIPPKANRKESRAYDRHLYKERHLIEVFIGRLKQFRRVFSRFDKTARNYMSFIRFAAALIWCR